MSRPNSLPTDWRKEFLQRYLASAPGVGLLVAPGSTENSLIASMVVAELVGRRRMSGAILHTLRPDEVESWLRKLKYEHGHCLVLDYGPSVAPLLSRLRKAMDGNPKARVLILSEQPPDIPAPQDFDLRFEFYLGRTVTAANSGRIVRVSPSFRLLRELQSGSHAIDDMSWRDFESVIAELLEHDGYNVKGMKGTRDGGVDVIAEKDLGPDGWYRVLWQAKKNSVMRRVGISVVRELADTRMEFGASKGVIVTSSYLTKGALKRIERDKFILGKVDRDDLDAWISRAIAGRYPK